MSYSGKFLSRLLLFVFLFCLMTGCCLRQKCPCSKNALQGCRLEHVAINVPDPVDMVAWYTEHLGMQVIRKGPPPANMHFIADAGRNMMLEVYSNPPDQVPDYLNMNPLTLHIAFMVDDVAAMREKLLAAGATAEGEIKVTEKGDTLAMLRDPWGVPIQFVKRADPMYP